MTMQPGAPGPAFETWDRMNIRIPTTLPEGGKKIAQGVSPGTRCLKNLPAP